MITLGLLTGLTRLGIQHRFCNLHFKRHEGITDVSATRPSAGSPIPTERPISSFQYAWRLGIRGWPSTDQRPGSVHHLTNQLLAPTFKKRPMILTLDNLAPLKWPESTESGPWKRRLYNSIIVSARKSAAAVICPTLYMKGQAIEAGVPEKSIHVIHYSTELSAEPSPSPSEVRKALPRTRILLSVGGEMIRKRIDLQIRALKQLDGWSLVRVFPGGRPADRNRALIQDLGLERRVLYLSPPIGHEHEFVNSIYRAADCVIHTAVYGSFEFVPVEASLARTPVVAPNLDPMKELLRGLLYVDDFENPNELADAVARSANWNTDEAFECASQYTHVNQASRVSSLYNEVGGQ